MKIRLGPRFEIQGFGNISVLIVSSVSQGTRISPEPIHFLLTSNLEMTSTINLSKLAEIRMRTDRDLVRIIDHELELGLHSQISAAKAWAAASKLLPAVEDLAERRRLEKKLAQLEGALSRPSSPGAGVSPLVCACVMGQWSRG
jgi:hypothetical protein